MHERRARGLTACLADVASALNDPNRAREQLYRAMVTNAHANGQRRDMVSRAGQQQLNREVKPGFAVTRHTR